MEVQTGNIFLMSEQEIDKMTSVAKAIVDGSLGKGVVYCAEEDCFYVYENFYWKRIKKLKLLKQIIETKGYSYLENHTFDKRMKIIDNLTLYAQIDQTEFNSRGFLNFDVGEYDPIEMKMHGHEQKFYSTIRMPYPFDGSAKCELWDKTLSEIFEGDKLKIELLQEFFGYCLTRDTRREKALLLLGESRTGKSTILHILGNLIGEENCSYVPLKHIGNPQYTPMMVNKLVNIDTDVSNKAEEFEDDFKVITSGERVSCNQKYVETFHFSPYCKLVMAANEFPVIRDHSSAFYKRIILIPCDRIFDEKEQDVRLKDKLIQELPGIFNWAVAGLVRLNNNNKFQDNEDMKQAVEDLREQSNPIDVFLREHIQVELNNGTFTLKSDLFQYFQSWCTKNEIKAISAIRFSQCVYRKFSQFTEKKSQDIHSGKRIWRNLKYVEQKGEAQGEQVSWTDD